jgi:AcrR family transcriptional regulator
MVAAEGSRSLADEDLTARARIRDAALLQFAERGIRGATIRGIAEAAGVSPGLVQHHFGSKEALREACDTYAMDLIRQTKDEAGRGGMEDPGFLAAAMRTAMPIRRYVARAMVDGSPSAATLFDDMVAYTEQYLSNPPPQVAKPQTSDLHAYAAAITAMNIGVLVLHEHLSRALDANTLTVEGSPRLFLAMTDVFSDNLLSPELVAQSRAALEQMMAASPTPVSEDGNG